MSAFGAKFIHFAPYKSETGGKIEYDEPVKLGALVKAELTVNLASGEIHGDDALDEKLEEFVSGTLAVEVTDMMDEVEAKVFGSTKKPEGELVDNVSDNIPYGGVGYYKTLMRKGKKYYKAHFYPKAKAVMGNDSAQTKGSSITFASVPLSFTVQETEDGYWRYRQTFETEEEAQKYVLEKLGKASEAV